MGLLKKWSPWKTLTQVVNASNMAVSLSLATEYLIKLALNDAHMGVKSVIITRGVCLFQSHQYYSAICELLPTTAIIFEHSRSRDVNKGRGICLSPRDPSPLLMIPPGRHCPHAARRLQPLVLSFIMFKQIHTRSGLNCRSQKWIY